MKQRLNEVAQLQRIAGILKEEDTSFDSQREEAIDQHLNTAVQAIKGIHDIYQKLSTEDVSLDYILDMVKKEMTKSGEDVSDENMPFEGIAIKKRTPAQIEAEENLLKKIADFKQKHPDFQYASDATVRSDVRKSGALRAGIDFDKARAAYARDKATSR